MPRNVTGFTLGLAVLALLSAGCGGAKDRGPKKEAILPLLQQEAQSLKRDGEKGDPKTLGISSTWTIQGVELTEQPGNADAPWLGTIRIKIESTMKDELGAVQTQSFEKKFVYVWNVTLSRWLIQYTPPSPAAKKKP
jgi:hypothetical protein